MPIKKFQCYECGLEFEEMRKMSQKDEGCPCPSCPATAKKQVSASNFSFQHKPTGPVPQNTGVASVDYNFDRVIGRDAEQKWKGIEERRSQKIKHVEAERRSGKDIGMQHVTPTLDGGFRTLTNSEVSRANSNREVVQKYNKSLKKK